MRARKIKKPGDEYVPEHSVCLCCRLATHGRVVYIRRQWRLVDTVHGIKMVAVRMKRPSANAQVIAEAMVEHPTFERLYYRGPEDQPGHELTARAFAERPSCSIL